MKNPVCRKCRREGIKLFLKGERCDTPKCSFTKRNYAPGIHGNTRSRRPSDYCIQLREKQKARSIYNITERQFKNIFLKAAKSKANTGERLLQLLELRLDNIVFRLGFACSRRAARQLVGHGAIIVNKKKVTIPSYTCKEDDILILNQKERKLSKSTELPVWLKLDKGKLTGQILKIPARDNIETNINEQLIIEFYSR